VLLPLVAIDAASAIRTTALAAGTTTAATAVAQQVGLASGQGEARIVGIDNCPLQTWEGERETANERLVLVLGTGYWRHFDRN